MTKPTDVSVENPFEPTEPPESYFVPAADVYETADGLTLLAEMPGVKPDGLTVTVEENVLVLRGDPAAADEAGELLLKEFEVGPFYRAFRLPADYDTQKIDAKLKQGLLTLHLPKSERLKPRRIEVTVDE